MFPSLSCPRAWLMAVLCAAVFCARADLVDDELERENLARIAQEIAIVKAMVIEAQDRAPTGQRIKFRYDWLARDLELLRDGVLQHADAPRQPRPVAPLRGDYRQ